MKQLRCGDTGCPTVNSGLSDTEVLQKAVQHARDAHQVKTFRRQTFDDMRAAIVDSELPFWADNL